MLRMALIGCGARAEPYLAAARNLPDVEVAAVADPNSEQAARLALSADVALRKASLDELLDAGADAFDAVVVTVPLAARGSLVEGAVGAGKHVLVEPPLADGAEEAERAAAAARASGVRLMPAHGDRFRADCRAVRASLDQGELGRAGLLRIHDWSPATEGGSNDPGALAALDLALWMFDGPPSHVYAVGRPSGAATLTQAEYLQVHLGFEAGGMALIDVARRLPAGDGYRSLALIGSLGAAHADDHHNVQLLYGGGRAQAVLTEADESVPALLLAEFAAAIAEGREPAVSGEDGAAVLRVAEAAASSCAAEAALRLSGGRYELA